jgi:hypothetical protein
MEQIARNDLEVRKKLLRLVLSTCTHLDPSGTRRLLYTEKIDASSPWAQGLNQRSYMPGWRYFAITLSLLPILLQLAVVAIAVPVAIIDAGYSLAEANGWDWIHTAIFASATLGLISRFLLFPALHVIKVNYTEWRMRNKFYEDVGRYGITGALLVLDDQVQKMADDLDLASKSGKRKRYEE